ncbi:MAG: site-specific DNA-methyltransferase [Nitrospiraceae bacterium]
MSRVEHLAEGVTLYCGDCREILPSLGKVDAVVTDPPYGIAFVHGAGGDGIGGGKYVSKFNGVAIAGDDVPFDPAPLLDLAPVTILFGANHFADRLPSASKWLVWDKRKGFTRNDFADCEMAWTNIGGVARLINHYWNGMMRDSEKGIPRVHPTQKPIEVMQWVIKEIPPPATLILDPFMGSGTTGVAAVKLGRKFIGIEIEPKYFEIAVRRISEALKQPDMFIEKPKPLKQEALL